MEFRFLHSFRLTVEGLSSTFEFRMPYEVANVAEATDACAKYIARLEDNFLPVEEGEIVRANKVLRISHTGTSPFKES